MSIAQKLKQEGSRREALRIAGSMLQNGLDTETLQRITELSAEIFRSFVEKIEVQKPEKVPGTRTKKQTLVIWWNFIGAVDIPEEQAEHRKTA